MTQEEIDGAVRELRGGELASLETQIIAALLMRLDDQGHAATHCVVLGDAATMWPPMDAARVGNGTLWCGVVAIRDVLNRCNELDIETPEDFGMPVSRPWIVGMHGGVVEFNGPAETPADAKPATGLRIVK